MAKKAKKKIYLAHNIFARREGVEIQKKVENLGYEVLNPFYPKTYVRLDVQAIDRGEERPWGITSKEHGERIIEEDLKLVDEADILLAILPRGRTIGIPCEMMHAKEHGKKIYTVAPPTYRGHGWVVGLSDEIFNSVEEVLVYLKFLENKD